MEFFIILHLGKQITLFIVAHRKKYINKESFCSAVSQWERDCASVCGIEEDGKGLFAECFLSNLKRRIN